MGHIVGQLGDRTHHRACHGQSQTGSQSERDQSHQDRNADYVCLESVDAFRIQQQIQTGRAQSVDGDEIHPPLDLYVLMHTL